MPTVEAMHLSVMHANPHFSFLSSANAILKQPAINAFSKAPQKPALSANPLSKSKTPNASNIIQLVLTSLMETVFNAASVLYWKQASVLVQLIVITLKRRVPSVPLDLH